MQLLHPHRIHAQVRRVQSEKDHLTYRDRLVKHNPLRHNGLLLHTESAPEIVETPPPLPVSLDSSALRILGGVALLEHSRAGGAAMRTSSSTAVAAAMAPSSSPRVTPDRNQLEVKIEYVDQLHGPSSRRDLGSTDGLESKGQQQQQRVGMVPLSPRRFAEEKQKFISEAQHWSRQVDSEMAKKKKVEEPGAVHLPATLGVPHPSPLGGLFTARMATGQTSLSSKFSQEEREKILQQHFEQIQQQQHFEQIQQQQHFEQIQQQQQQQLLAGSAPSSSKPHPPHSLSISTAHSAAAAGHAPLKLSPHHATHPTASSATPSPKKSPFPPAPPAPPAAPSTAGVTASMLPFLSQAAGLQNLPATAATSFLHPSMTQYPPTMTFNPIYQAALQQLMAMQVKGTPPMLVSDPSIFQSLMDKVPIFLPDGSITFVPTNPQASGQGRATSPRKEEEPMKSPPSEGVSNHKRVRSPDSEMRADMRGSPPKRRRSTSLPDITQIPGSIRNLKEGGGGGIKEEVDDDNMGVVITNSTSSSEPRPARQLAPPTMIHIPQDIKMNDPMLGFPTPPQSSPLVGNFALSPIVFSSTAYHAHQPMTPVTPNQTPLGVEQLRELVEVGGTQQTTVPMPPSPDGGNLPPCKSTLCDSVMCP